MVRTNHFWSLPCVFSYTLLPSHSHSLKRSRSKARHNKVKSIRPLKLSPNYYGQTNCDDDRQGNKSIAAWLGGGVCL